MPQRSWWIGVALSVANAMLSNFSPLLAQTCTGTNVCNTGCFPPTYQSVGMPAGDGLAGGRTYNVCTDTSFDTFATTVKQKDGGVDLQQSLSSAITDWNRTLSSIQNPVQYTLNSASACDITISAAREACGSSCEVAEWDPDNKDQLTPSTSGQVVWNTNINFPSQVDSDQTFVHEFGHASGLADANSTNSQCSATDTVMWFTVANEEACTPTNCDQGTESNSYNCTATTPPTCPTGQSPACEDATWYCVVDGCTDVCDSRCINYYDPSDPSCGDGCYDICDPSCVNYDPSDPSCGGCSGCQDTSGCEQYNGGSDYYLNVDCEDYCG